MLAVRSDMQWTGEWGSLGIAHAEDISLNNNRGNNRRRGRGNNRQQGGQQLNRIDSRARGNAQQLLDKYRKMAHDAHLNGDRVQEEYYLQFADHYFRVLADQRVRQEESRVRRDDRPQDSSERGRYDDSRGRYDYEYGDETGEDEPVQAEARDAREPRGEDRDRSGYEVDSAGAESDSDGREGDVYEASDNPFVRETRAPRAGGRTRAPRRDSRNVEGEDQRHDENEARPEAGVDPSVLPPSIGLAVEDVAEEAAPKPRRRTRKPRATDGNDESLEAVG
jgi:hypothetical protein